MDEGAKRYCGGWINRQPELFPWLEDAIDPITARLERLIILLGTLSLEAFVVHLRKTMVERTASPRRKQATAWSGDAELFGLGDPGERAGGDDTDAVSTPWAWHPDPQSPYLRAQLGFGMIRSSQRFTRLQTSVSSAERLGHSGGDQLGIAFVAIWPLCKCLSAQKTWNLIFPYTAGSVPSTLKLLSCPLAAAPPRSFNRVSASAARRRNS